MKKKISLEKTRKKTMFKVQYKQKNTGSLQHELQK